MKKPRNMLLGLVIFLLISIVGLYFFAPHAPRTPKQVNIVDELETYLARLVQSENPPGLSLVVDDQDSHCNCHNATAGTGQTRT